MIPALESFVIQHYCQGLWLGSITLPETPAQAMPAMETTEGKQEDMLACALQTKKISFSSRLCLPLPIVTVIRVLPNPYRISALRKLPRRKEWHYSNNCTEVPVIHRDSLAGSLLLRFRRGHLLVRTRPGLATSVDL